MALRLVPRRAKTRRTGAISHTAFFGAGQGPEPVAGAPPVRPTGVIEGRSLVPAKTVLRGIRFNPSCRTVLSRAWRHIDVRFPKSVARRRRSSPASILMKSRTAGRGAIGGSRHYPRVALYPWPPGRTGFRLGQRRHRAVMRWSFRRCGGKVACRPGHRIPVVRISTPVSRLRWHVIELRRPLGFGRTITPVPVERLGWRRIPSRGGCGFSVLPGPYPVGQRDPCEQRSENYGGWPLHDPILSTASV